MPDGPSGEKTEKPTPRRLEKAKEEGQLAKSQELNSAFTLLASFFTLYFLFANIIQSLSEKMTSFLSLSTLPAINLDNSYTILIDLILFIARVSAPVMIASAILGAFINLVQVGPRFSTKLIQMKFSKINPIEGAKRLFSLKSLIELIKSLLKATIILFLTYNQIMSAWPELILLSGQGFEPALIFVANLIFRIAVNIIIFLIILGIVDYVYQRWEFMRNLMMTKQEVKEEYKEMEGDPHVKSQRRQIQREMSMNRMMASVEDADVVITNPTHIAVALKFDLESMEAPVVLAKGEGFIAQKIKEVAKEAEIEIVENKPLARALNATTEIGEEIPADLYQAVAEVLAYLYNDRV
ncbi:flagellar biosynthesis protein FlhB [Natronospora cellulosivora (SeqCode)]